MLFFTAAIAAADFEPAAWQAVESLLQRANGKKVGEGRISKTMGRFTLLRSKRQTLVWIPTRRLRTTMILGTTGSPELSRRSKSSTRTSFGLSPIVSVQESGVVSLRDLTSLGDSRRNVGRGRAMDLV